MKNLAVIALTIISLLFSSCADSKKNEKENEPEVITVDTTPKKEFYTSEDGDVKFEDELITAVYKEYIELKMAFVNNSSKLASYHASLFMEKLNDAKADKNLIKTTQKIIGSSDIEEQRMDFTTITSEVEKMIQGQIKSGTVYKQYCPMAFNNKGGYWLSNSKDIYNPFFGDKMLKCGRVDSEIK